jgi:hypothetical protein
MKMNNQNLKAPAFPCVPIQDNFGRLIAAIPGITKLEYFTLKIWSCRDILDIETYEEAIQEAELLLNELEKYQNKTDEDTDTKILSIN